MHCPDEGPDWGHGYFWATKTSSEQTGAKPEASAAQPFYFSSLYCCSAIEMQEAFLSLGKDPTPFSTFAGRVLVRARVNSAQGRKVLSKQAVGPACLGQMAVTQARWASDTQQEFSIRTSFGWLESKAF